MSEYEELIEIVEAGKISFLNDVPSGNLEQLSSAATGVDGEGVWRATNGASVSCYVFVSGMCLQCESESHAFLALSALEDSQNAEAFRKRFGIPDIAAQSHRHP